MFQRSFFLFVFVSWFLAVLLTELRYDGTEKRVERGRFTFCATDM